jgi:hypothetical protein
VQHRVLGGRQVADALLQPALVLALFNQVERRGSGEGGERRGLPVVERDRRKVRQMMCDLMTQYCGDSKSAAEWFRLMRFSDDKSGEVYKPSARLPV